MGLTIGVLAFQGGVIEHMTALKKAAASLQKNVTVIEVRSSAELESCDAGLVIPGGESTHLSRAARECGLLEPLRDYVKAKKRPVWGTCAGLIMLSEEASAVKQDGQELIGGLDVRVHRNHFGRQNESFMTNLDLEFLRSSNESSSPPFPAMFIRAPVVDKLLLPTTKAHDAEATPKEDAAVEVLAILPGRHASNKAAAAGELGSVSPEGAGDIIALRQGKVFGTSFHPELTDDIRIHEWWLQQILS
ncbi:pyridoxal 5'-phosphate synthase- glutaminase subunit Pdx2 [Apiospora aurea]|uniref:Pyridoxal 5'-phosphate synthase- glutaminase subunit Pdx2 n=1 Tax=Apiospora aurea TaxID=335848 RepID=A0ABR1QGB9_9PEZI